MPNTTTPLRPEGLRQSTREDYLARMSRLQAFLRDHLDHDIDPDTLAGIACMSKAHFHRVFRAMFGETVMEHTRRLRLERAAQRLRFTRDGILDVAVGAGYSSHEAFTRAFQARFGLTPSSFRATPSRRIETIEPVVLGAAREVAIRRIEPLQVVALRHWGAYISVSSSFTKLVEAGRRAGHFVGSPSLLGCYHDDPDITPLDQLRSDVCYIIEGEVEVSGELTRAIVPGGMYAVLVHHGPYETLSTTYLDLIGRWLPDSGYELCPESVVEVYLNDPKSTPPEALRTEVRVRLQRA